MNSSTDLSYSLVISINEARKLLGKEARGYSDDKVEKIILDLDGIASEYFNLVPDTVKYRYNTLDKGSK